MKKVVLLIVVVVAVIVTLVFSNRSRQDLSQFQHLEKPQIRTLPRQKMLVVEIKGDPNVVGKEAFSALFKTFFGIKRQAKSMEMQVPRARWPKPMDTPKDEWVGIYGIPIPESVKTLPARKDGPEVKIEYWEYGEIAEILHIGPYSEETPAIEKLHAFIKESGYKIAGDHEEEYLKGPGMFGSNPAEYQTIIRYPVKKVKR